MSESENTETAEHETKLDINQRKRVRHRKKLLYEKILKQMEFYFSNANLTKDRILGELVKIDPYVQLDFFLKCNKIHALTQDVLDIVKAMKHSTLLQLSEDKTKVKRKIPLEPYDADARTVYVESIPVTASLEWLERVFSEYGPIAYISLPRFKTSKRIKGFAFIEFEKPEDAQKCVDAFTKMGCKLPTCMPPEELCSIKLFSVEDSGKIEDKEEEKEEVKESSEPPKKKMKKNKEKKPKLELKADAESDSDRTVDTPTILLRECVKQHIDIIENKSTDTNTNKKKIMAWQSVGKSFNELNDRDRAINELKQQWRIAKINAKKENSAHKRALKCTGGGEKPPSPSWETAEIITMIPQEFTEEFNIFDSDQNQTENKTIITSIEDSKPGDSTKEESSQGEEKKETSDTPRKKKSKKRNKDKKKINSLNPTEAPKAALWGLQILPKSEWKRLRNKYLNLQRKYMKEMKFTFKNQNHYAGIPAPAAASVEVGQGVKPEDEKISLPLEKIPGVFVEEILPEPCLDVRQTKRTIRSNIHALHVDAKEGKAEVIIRFDSAKAANEYCAASTNRARVLSATEETEQWNRAEAARSNRRPRGRDRILAKHETNVARAALSPTLPQPTHTHLRFDEE